MHEKNSVTPEKAFLPRRSFVTRAGLFGLSAAAAAFLPGTPLRADSDDRDDLSGDTAQEIFTAALIAEDLASTFYYNWTRGAGDYGSEPGGAWRKRDQCNGGWKFWQRGLLPRRSQRGDRPRQSAAQSDWREPPRRAIRCRRSTFRPEHSIPWLHLPACSTRSRMHSSEPI